MTSELWLLDRGPTQIAAIIRNGDFIDIARKNENRRTTTGSRFIGKIVEKNSNLRALFVDLGLARPGFLPLSKTTKPLTIGQSVDVTCVSELSALKGPSLKLNAIPTEKAETPTLIFDADDPVSVLRNRKEEIDLALCNEPALVDCLRAKLPTTQKISPVAKSNYSDNWQQDLLEYCEALDDPTWIFDASTGASLLFEPGQTLLAIDVNSGSGVVRDEEERLKINLIAAEAIAKQIKLRQLSGQIVVDFLGLERRESRQLVTQKVEKRLAILPNRFEVVPMNSLGLVCLSLQRLYPAFHESK